MQSRAEIFEELTKKAADTYRRKNADYGDSFVKVRNKFPNSVLIRLNDKLNRLEMLMGRSQRARVKEESIEDTLLDLANYALMELTERIYEKQVVASDAAPVAAATAAMVATPSGVSSAAPTAAPAASLPGVTIGVDDADKLADSLQRSLNRNMALNYGV